MWEFATNVIGFFFNTLRGLAAGIVGRIMIGLGIGLTSFVFVLPEVLDFIQGYFDNLSPTMTAYLAYLNVDRAMNIVISAIAAKFGMSLNLVKLGPAE